MPRIADPVTVYGAQTPDQWALQPPIPRVGNHANYFKPLIGHPFQKSRS